MLVGVILFRILLHLCINFAPDILNLIILAVVQMHIGMLVPAFITG